MATRLGSINGVALAYVMALANAGLQLVISFGVHVTTTQQTTITIFINAALVLVAHVAHAQAKHTKEVIPAPPLDESHPPPVT